MFLQAFCLVRSMEQHQRVTHTDVLECTQLFSKRDEYVQWEKLSQCSVRYHEVHIHRKMREGSDLYDLFSYGTLPVSAEAFERVNWDIDYRTKWDSYAKSIRVIESKEADADNNHLPHDLVHWVVAFPWPMSHRDYVYLRHRQSSADGVRVLISKGVAQSSVDELSGVIRVEELRTYIVVRPVETDANCCEFAMLYFDDMKGSIPRSIVNWAVSKAIPSFLNQLVDAADKAKPL
jgi:hypothetical protein